MKLTQRQRFALLLLVLRQLARLPLFVTRSLALLLTPLALIPKRRRHVAWINLRLCFPQRSVWLRLFWLVQHFYRVLALLLDYPKLWWWPQARLWGMVKLRGSEHLALGEGALLVLAPHSVGLDVGWLMLSARLNPLSSVYTRQSNRRMHLWLYLKRRRFGGYGTVRTDGLGTVARLLKRGYALQLSPDLDFGAHASVFVPFFAEPAATATSLGRIAQLAQARVIGSFVRQSWRGYDIELSLLPSSFPSGDTAGDTRTMNQWIEQQVQRDVSQYLWLHRRFKTRPEHALPVYD